MENWQKEAFAIYATSQFVCWLKKVKLVSQKTLNILPDKDRRRTIISKHGFDQSQKPLPNGRGNLQNDILHNR